MVLPRNNDGFLDILEKHKGVVYKIARAYSKDDEARKDLIQEIVLQLWRSYPSYNEAYALTTWIYRIALNVCISAYRREHRRAGINLPLPNEILELHDPSHATGQHELVGELYQAIYTLKELDRALILLYLDAFSQQEMADVLGLTVTNIATRLSRIRQQLRIKLSTV